MGLEIVEMVMEIEEAFDLSTPDQDAERIHNPREVIDYVMAHLRVREDSCLTQTAFYRLRRAAVSCLAVPRSAVRPAAPWNDLLPRWRRRRAWNQFVSGCGMALPRPRPSDTVGDTATSAAEFLKLRSAGLTREQVSTIVHRLIVKVYGFDIGDQSYFVDH